MDHRIPKSFELFGKTVKVVIDDEYCQARDLLGQASSVKNTIHLQRNGTVDNQKITYSPDQVYSIFVHEKIHLVLDIMGKEDLSANEEFVEVISGLLHQSEKSAKY